MDKKLKSEICSCNQLGAVCVISSLGWESDWPKTSNPQEQVLKVDPIIRSAVFPLSGAGRARPKRSLWAELVRRPPQMKFANIFVNLVCVTTILFPILIIVTVFDWHHWQRIWGFVEIKVMWKTRWCWWTSKQGDTGALDLSPLNRSWTNIEPWVGRDSSFCRKVLGGTV